MERMNEVGDREKTMLSLKKAEILPSSKDYKSIIITSEDIKGYKRIKLSGKGGDRNRRRENKWLTIIQNASNEKAN